MDSKNGEGEGKPPLILDAGDWRSQLQPNSRHQMINKIMETLKRHLPVSGAEGLSELRKIAERFEEKIYIGATSQSDYLMKISLKMLTMETSSMGNPWCPPTSLWDLPGDWRSQLPPNSRHQIVNKIMETLKRHLPVSGAEGPSELRKIAERFEEKIYIGATSLSDYLRKISLKMLTMEAKSQPLD